MLNLSAKKNQLVNQKSLNKSVKQIKIKIKTNVIVNNRIKIMMIVLISIKKIGVVIKTVNATISNNNAVTIYINLAVIIAC